MPQSLANILIHITFSTKNRHPFLTPEIQPEVNSYIAAVARASDCPAVRVESMQDHVHLVVALSRTAALSDLIEEIKTSSSRWIKRKGESFSEFHWQRGYGAFSVSQSALQSVLDYLACQQEHHKVVSFQEEFRRFLEKHGIHFDGALPLHCEPPAQMDAAARACIDECRARRFMLSPTAGPYEATIGDCVRDNYIQFLASAWKHGARPEYGMA